MDKLNDAITQAQLAAALNLSKGTLANWRSQGKGPASFLIGNRVLYSRSDVDLWVAEQYAQAKGDALATR